MVVVPDGQECRIYRAGADFDRPLIRRVVVAGRDGAGGGQDFADVAEVVGEGLVFGAAGGRGAIAEAAEVVGAGDAVAGVPLLDDLVAIPDEDFGQDSVLIFLHPAVPVVVVPFPTHSTLRYGSETVLCIPGERADAVAAGVSVSVIGEAPGGGWDGEVPVLGGGFSLRIGGGDVDGVRAFIHGDGALEEVAAGGGTRIQIGLFSIHLHAGEFVHMTFHHGAARAADLEETVHLVDAAGLQDAAGGLGVGKPVSGLVECPGLVIGTGVGGEVGVVRTHELVAEIVGVGTLHAGLADGLLFPTGDAPGGIIGIDVFRLLDGRPGVGDACELARAGTGSVVRKIGEAGGNGVRPGEAVGTRKAGEETDGVASKGVGDGLDPAK